MTESRFIARSVSIIVLAIATVLMLGSCGFTIGGPQAAICNRDSDNSAFSTIDPEGAACILTFHEARFDMSRGTIAKTALGVEADEYAPDVSSDDGLIDLEILGPDGTLDAATDRIRFFTTDTQPDVDRITYFLTANSPDELFQLVRDGSDVYGFDRTAVEDWITAASSDPHGTSDFAFDPGTALGMNVSYDLRYDENASVQVVIVDVSPL